LFGLFGRLGVRFGRGGLRIDRCARSLEVMRRELRLEATARDRQDHDKQKHDGQAKRNDREDGHRHSRGYANLR